MQVKFFYYRSSLILSGGLRREFYSLIAKELFDPQFGLFRLSENKLSIQPNPLASIVPNYLLYFEFAGLMLAKVNNCLMCSLKFFSV